MRLLLVMPTGLQVGYDDYFSSSPMGIETIAAHARALADVDLADMRGQGHDVEAHAEMLLKRNPEMVGITCNAAPHTKYVLALAAALRRRKGDLKIVTGGQQVTFLAQEVLEEGNVNAVVRGEGEITMCEILKAGGKFEGIAGVSWRSNGTIHHEADRPLIENLDHIEIPARELLPNRNRYRMGSYRIEGVESSRGCPFNCSFCSVRNFHRGAWRPKSVDRVMKEVDLILDRYREPKVIYFCDDNFAHDIGRVAEICKAIIARKTAAYFWCQARVDRLAANPEIIDLMGEAKFSAVLVGIETPVERLLKSAKKGTSIEQIHKAIDLLHARDIGVWGTFTLGLPGETREETEQTAKFIPTTNVDVAQVTVVTPIPGSKLYDDAKAAGDITTFDWDKFDFTSPVLKGQLSKAEMDKFMQQAYFKVYVSWRFLSSLFSTRTNLNRLRRTAFSVFWTWIWYLLKEKGRNFFDPRRWFSKKARAAKAWLPEQQ